MMRFLPPPLLIITGCAVWWFAPDLLTSVASAPVVQNAQKAADVAQAPQDNPFSKIEDPNVDVTAMLSRPLFSETRRIPEPFIEPEPATFIEEIVEIEEEFIPEPKKVTAALVELHLESHIHIVRIGQ